MDQFFLNGSSTNIAHQPSCEAFYESAELILSVNVDWNKPTLHKVALQVALKSSVFMAGPRFQTACQQFASYVLQYPISPIRMSTQQYLAYLGLSVDDSSTVKGLSSTAIVFTRDFGDLVSCFCSALKRVDDRNIALTTTTVALTKFLTAMIQGESIFDTSQLLFTFASDNENNNNQTDNASKQLVGHISNVLREEYNLLGSESYCFHFLKSLLHLAENTIDSYGTSLGESHGRSKLTTTQRQNIELALGFFCTLIRSSNNIDLVNFGYTELSKLLQKKLPGRLLSLASIGLGEIFAVSIDSLPPGEADDRVKQVMAVLSKVEERVVFHARQLIIVSQKENLSQFEVDRQASELLDRAKGACAGFVSISKVMIQQSMVADLNLKCGILIDRFLHVLTEMLPLVKKSDTFHLSEFIINLSSLFLRPMKIMLDGILFAELNAPVVEESFGRLSKFIRLWIGISITAVKVSVEMEVEFRQLVSQLAKVTPPLVFGKLLGLSKSTDLGDELVMNDPLLEQLIRDCISPEDRAKLHSAFGLLSEGLRPASFFLLNATRLLETSRVESVADIRPLIGYFCDLHNWFSPAKRAVILQLTNQIEEAWIRSVFTKLTDYGYFQDSSEGINEDEDDEQQSKQKHKMHDEDVVMSLDNFQYFLEDQVTFLIERCMDDRDEVRNYCASLLLRLIAELPWMVSHPNDLIVFCLDSLTVLEKAMHAASAYNPHEQASLLYPSDDYLMSLEESGSTEEISFVTLLRFRRMLPVLSFPLREDRIAAVSNELMSVVYAWLSAPSFSQSLKESILQGYIAKYSNTAGHLSLSIASEMLSSPRPTFHTQRAEGSLFDKARSHAAHQVIIAVDKQRHGSRFSHWVIKDSVVKNDANDLQASKAELDVLGDDLEKGSDTGGLLDLLGEETDATDRVNGVVRPHDLFAAMVKKVVNRLEIVQAGQPSDREIGMLSTIRQLDTLIRVLYSRVKLQPEGWSAYHITTMVANICEAISNIASQCRGSDEVGAAVLRALEHAYAIFPRQQPQMIAIIIPIVHELCIVSLSVLRSFCRSQQYLLRFIGILATSRTMIGYLATRSLAESLLQQIAATGNEVHLSDIPSQLVLFLGLQSLQMFHSQQHAQLPIASNRILRENLFVSVAILATRKETNDIGKERLFAAPFTNSQENSKSNNEGYDDEVHECTNWCKLLYLLLEDQKRWFVDYDRKPADSKPAKLRSTSSVISIVSSGEESGAERQNSRIYFGAVAAFDAIFTQLCKFNSAFRKLQSLSAFSVGYVHEPTFASALCNQQAFGLGSTTGSGLTVEAKKTEQLLSSSGVLSAVYMMIAHRIDYLKARVLSTYGTIVLDAHEALDALEIVNELKKMVDLTLTQSIQVYKFSAKALWIVAPPLALSLKQIYNDLSHKDGKRKGINHLALFLSCHLAHVTTFRDYRVLPLLLDVIYHKDSTDTDKSICLHAIDMLDDAPLYFILQMLSRCDAYHQQAWDHKSQNTITNLMRYLQRVLYRADMQLIMFYLPQLVQLLRRDEFGTLFAFLVQVATTSPTICHQLVWALQTECKSSQDEKHAKLLQSKNKSGELKHGLCGQLPGLDPLPSLSRQLIETITESLPDQDYRYLQDEMSLFNYITDISSKLKDVPKKDAHGAVVKELLEHIVLPEGVYLPTNPYRRVKSIELDSARPMQSAAKCPYLLKFQTVRWRGPDAFIDFVTQREISSSPEKDDGNDVIFDEEPKLILRTKSKLTSGIGKKSGTFTGPRGLESNIGTGSESLDRPGGRMRTPECHRVKVGSDNVVKSSGNARHLPSPYVNRGAGNMLSPAKLLSPLNRLKSPHAALSAGWDDQQHVQDTEDACIFKTHDDCRQDLLTLQIIRLLKNWFQRCQLPVYVVPYHVVCNRTGAAGNVGGILEVVKHVSSRDQLGKAGAKTLLQHFVTQFGQVGSENFHNAQLAFARSLAPYAVICHLLHIKVR